MAIKINTTDNLVITLIMCIPFMVQNSCVVILEVADTNKKEFSVTEDKLLLFQILQSFMVLGNSCRKGNMPFFPGKM